MKDKIIEQIKEVLTKGKNENDYFVPYVGLYHFDENFDLLKLFKLIYESGFRTGKKEGKKEFQEEIKKLLDIKDAD